MWLSTIYGHFSVASARTANGSLDPDTLMVRARCRDHLLRLQERLPSLAAFPILATPKADYPFRLIVPKALWAASLSELALEQAWSNFKNEAEAFQGEAGREYIHALHDVWARMAHLKVAGRGLRAVSTSRWLA